MFSKKWGPVKFHMGLAAGGQTGEGGGVCNPKQTKTGGKSVTQAGRGDGIYPSMLLSEGKRQSKRQGNEVMRGYWALKGQVGTKSTGLKKKKFGGFDTERLLGGSRRGRNLGGESSQG